MHSTQPPSKNNDKIINIYQSIIHRDDLTLSEKLACSYLVSQIHFKAISIAKSDRQFSEKDQYTSLSSRELADAIGMTKLSASRTIKKLIESEVIKETSAYTPGSTKVKIVMYSEMQNINESIKFSIPSSILSRTDLTQSDKLIYSRYYSFRDGHSKVSNNIMMSTISNNTGVSRASTTRSIKKLVEHGLILTEKVKNKVLVKVLKQTEKSND